MVATDPAAGTKGSRTAPTRPTITWQLIHAQPGALFYTAYGDHLPTTPKTRRDASIWAPSGTVEPGDGLHEDELSVLHYAGYIGRVGVLAAALGVGAAVAGTPGSAWADPAVTDSTTTSGSSESTATRAPRAEPLLRGLGKQHSAHPRGEAASQLTQPSSGTDVRAQRRAGVDGPSRGPTTTRAGMTQAGMAEQPIPELPELSRDTGDMTPVELGPKAPSAQPHATNIQAGNTTSTGSAETPTAVAPASAARASAEPISGANAPIVGSPAARLTTPLTAAATQSAKTPVRYGLSAWFRATFDNQTPVLAHDPTQNSQVDGTVTGAVTTLGPDGHALTFTAGVPVNGGTVVIAPDGTFTYSANRTLTQTGGTDTFTVTASDEMSGRHVHGLPGLLNLITNGMLGKAGHSATISVTVAVNPVTAAAKPGTPAYLVGGVDHVTGTVSGELDANDPDPHTLTYSLTDGPSRGIVTLNPDSGAFTYTPSQTDRHQAAAENATAEQLHDTFTVTVVDGRGSATAVPVSVDVDPANTDPALNLLVSDPDSDGSVHVSVIVTDPDNDPVTYWSSMTLPWAA